MSDTAALHQENIQMFWFHFVFQLSPYLLQSWSGPRILSGFMDGLSEIPLRRRNIYSRRIKLTKYCMRQNPFKLNQQSGSTWWDGTETNRWDEDNSYLLGALGVKWQRDVAEIADVAGRGLR